MSRTFWLLLTQFAKEMPKEISWHTPEPDADSVTKADKAPSESPVESASLDLLNRSKKEMAQKESSSVLPAAQGVDASSSGLTTPATCKKALQFLSILILGQYH